MSALGRNLATTATGQKLPFRCPTSLGIQNGLCSYRLELMNSSIDNSAYDKLCEKISALTEQQESPEFKSVLV